MTQVSAAATHVATLIAARAPALLTASHLARAAAVLPGVDAPRWLAPGEAADLPFAPEPGIGNRVWRDALRAAFAGEPIDVAVQESAFRRKRLLVADMDSTLIEQECIDELAAALGLREPITAITERSMRGEVAFEPALRERVALLRGLPLQAALRVFDDRVSIMPGARTLARTMRAHGAVTAIVSGGFTLFTARLAESLGFDSHFANALLIQDGALTGALDEPILDREGKGRVLHGLAYAHGLHKRETLAVGDGANDLAMLAAAGLGVAFRGKPALAAAADVRVDHGNLTALLYIQGYAQDEFAA